MKPMARIPFLQSVPLAFAAAFLFSAGCAFSNPAASNLPTSRLVDPGEDGKLVYEPVGERGDRIPDFSHSGYRGGGKALPEVAAAATVAPGGDGGDDTARVQAAIDEVAEREPGANGYRGAVLLEPGTYRIHGQLQVDTGGVVLRGSGRGDGGTVLLGIGEESRPIVRFQSPDNKNRDAGSRQAVTEAYVPLGSDRLTVEDASGFSVGDTVDVVRKGNAAWISHLGMDAITPRPSNPDATRNWGPFDLAFDRIVTAVEGNRITLDAPIGMAIDERWGGGAVHRYEERRIAHVGIENLSLVSDPAHETDENHRGRGVQFDRITNGWARDLTFRKLSHAAVSVTGNSKWITVRDCEYLEPASEIRGGRRAVYAVSSGQLVLVYRCEADEGRHSFHVGSRTAGPNAFVEGKATNTHGKSGPHHRWSVSTLYDSMDGGEYRAEDRQWYGTGHGWAGVNVVFWNCRGKLFIQDPPTAWNFAIGFVGEKTGPSHDFTGHDWGYVEHFGEHVTPGSLYFAQLEDRLGAEAVEAVRGEPE